jgi:hypothetical protein
LIHTIVGKRGRGKTSLVAELMTTLRYDRIFVYDYCGEFAQFAIENYIVVETNASAFSRFMVQSWEDAQAVSSSLLILDEIAVYGKDNPQIDHAYRLSRHVGMDIIGISQRFFSLPVITRSQTDVFHVFQITELRDLQYLRGVIGDQAAEKIRGLGFFQYINLQL